MQGSGAQPPTAASVSSSPKTNGTARATSPLGEEHINFQECLRATAALYGTFIVAQKSLPPRLILNRPMAEILRDIFDSPAQIAPDLAPSTRPKANGQQGSPEPDVWKGTLKEMLLVVEDRGLLRKKTLVPPEGGPPLPKNDGT